MSKFKVTLRKNGRPVGEMCYPSEAVAVSKAAAMTEAAPGTTASVSTATKSNPRRRRNTHLCRNPDCDCRANPRRRKNPARGGKKATDSYIFVEGKAPDGSYFGANYKRSQLPALYDALRAAGVQRVTLDETTEVDLTAARKNPARNGTWSAERMAAISQRAQFGRR